jgi:hypothetical protein
MSQFANIKREVNAVLDDPKRNGIYRLSDGNFGFANKLDGRALRSKKSLLSEVARLLDFPDYFDENWDSLEECLSDMSWHEGQIGLLIENADAIPAAVLETLLDVFLASAQFWATEGRACSLFLCDSDQPDIPLLA